MRAKVLFLAFCSIWLLLRIKGATFLSFNPAVTLSFRLTTGPVFFSPPFWARGVPGNSSYPAYSFPPAPFTDCVAITPRSHPSFPLVVDERAGLP